MRTYHRFFGPSAACYGIKKRGMCGGGWFLIIVAGACLAASACAQTNAGVPVVAVGAVEPSAPDVLDFVISGAESPVGTVTVEAVIKQSVDSEAELVIDDPGGARLASGAKTKHFTLKRGGQASRERVSVDVSDGKPRTVKARVRLLGADGKVWGIVEKELKMNQPTRAKAALEKKRVPVVHTRPDGSRVVEYLSAEDAVKRGLPAKGLPAPASPAPATGDKLER